MKCKKCYAITLDPHVYTVEEEISETDCEVHRTYTCDFCDNTYEETHKGHYYSESESTKTIMVDKDGTITIRNNTTYICDFCEHVGSAIVMIVAIAKIRISF